MVLTRIEQDKLCLIHSNNLNTAEEHEEHGTRRSLPWQNIGIYSVDVLDISVTSVGSIKFLLA